MAFWSSQTLEAKIRDQGLIRPPRDNAADCNAYTLRVGPEIYVTPTIEQGSANTHTKIRLSEGAPFTIPAGQFAFLMSEESVEVPTNAMAFISIKARIKFRGLVNVSGFHVDPGWKGPLIFAVFNAGPATVHLHRGQEMFLIWYADLDKASEKHKKIPGPSVIPSDIINNITGELNSFQNLSQIMREKDDELSDRIHEVEKSQARIVTTFYILGALLVGLIGWTFRGTVADLIKPTPTSQSAPATLAK